MKKTAIVVSKGSDYTAKLVSDWSLYYCLLHQKNFRFFNTDIDTIGFSRIVFEGEKVGKMIRFSNEEEEYELESVQGIYFRNGLVKLTNYTGLRGNLGKPNDLLSRMSNYFMAYESTVKDFFLDSVQSLKLIGFDNGAFINKITVLEAAVKVGLKTPNTLLATKKKELIDFAKINKNIITKSMGMGLSFFNEKNRMSYTQYTEEVYEDDLGSFPNEFPLTLFQGKIQKLFEIRTFYLLGKCYSCAMFTQNKKQTETDYRHYDKEDPARIVPFSLPIDIENRIDRLMLELGLSTGSIDIIYSTDNEYIFLEVNPSGQYIANSENCNFNLQKVVAQQLTL